MSRCPQCQHENPADAKFCLECGRRVALSCGACGTELPVGAKFCKQCGQAVGMATSPTAAGVGAPPESYTPRHLAEKILTSRAALEGERKQVTVLFADLKGSMELLADRDPEEARKLLDPVLEHMMDAVHRYEGTVNQVMGDGIMALFGAPLAHEDHAVRACYAALRMQESVKTYAEQLLRAQGISVQIRVGLNCGDVVVRAIGSDLHMDYTAVGQTTHLAARMEQLAPPGAVYATAPVLRLAEGHVTAREIGPTPVKGLPHPVNIWAITGTGPAPLRFEGAASYALTPFIGRDEPLGQLAKALSLAERGEGQVIAVVGDAGIGKSRLFWEFLHRHVSPTWTVLRGRSVSYGKASSYLPIVDLLKRQFQIADADSPSAIASRVLEIMRALDTTLESDVPALLAVLGVLSDDRQWEQLDPPQRRERVLEALKRLLLRLSLEGPVLLIVEDLHWIDAGTQEVLDTLVDALPTARILFLVNYRPEYQHTWAGKSFYAQIRLDPLPASISADFLDALLGCDVALVDLRRALVERTQGNPFFLEESVRHLADTGILSGERGAYRLARAGVPIDVPVTVQGVLAARIDRLQPEDKRLLQAAAVVGKDLPLRVLQTVAETQGGELRLALTRLQGAEFLREVRTFPESMYSFKHALTHEVTYGTLLGDRKKLLHGAVLAAMEHLYATRLTEHAETLAHHAVAGELWEKAVDYLREAGGKAYTRGALAEAAARFEEALAFGNRLSPSPENTRRRIDTILDLHAPLSMAGQFQRLVPLMQEAEALARELNDRVRLGRALIRLGSYRLLQARYSEFLEHSRQALESTAATGDVEIRLLATSQFGMGSLALGDYATAITNFRNIIDGRDVEMAKRRFGVSSPPYIIATAWLTWVLALVGNFQEALAAAALSLVAAESASPVAQAMSLFWRAMAFGLRGDFDRARRDAEGAVQLCETRGVLTWLPASYCAWGWSLSHSVSPSEGLSYLERAVSIHEATGAKILLSRMYLAWADGLLLAGDQGTAREKLQHALGLACRFGERGEEAEVSLLLADTEAACGQTDTAITWYHDAGRIGERLGMRPLLARYHAGLANLYRRTGEQAKTRQHLTTAMGMFREMGMTYWLEKAEEDMKELR